MGQRHGCRDRAGWETDTSDREGTQPGATQGGRFVHAVDITTDGRVPGAQVADEADDSYAELLAIARDHGPEEIKHLTRAYQAIAPAGGGRMIDLTALID
jgi:hypothetical protein